MDALDKFILEAELIHGWRATAVHEVQRDQPNRCRTYHAKDADGQFGFVKVLPPSTENLDLMRLHLEEFNSEREIVELCGQRNMRRIRPDDRLKTFVYRATQGLMKYSSGNRSGGAEDYKEAIKLSNGGDAALMVRSSWLDTQARWGGQIDEALLSQVILDSSKPGNCVAKGVAATAARFATNTQTRMSNPTRSPSSG